MRVTGLPLYQVETLVYEVSQHAYGGNITLDGNQRALSRTRCQLRLRAEDSRGTGARRAGSGRRGPYACWHAYRDVMSAAFAVNPNARIYTGMARYIGVDGFAANYPDTAYVNVGSLFAPAFMPSLCDCDGSVPTAVIARAADAVLTYARRMDSQDAILHDARVRAQHVRAERVTDDERTDREGSALLSESEALKLAEDDAVRWLASHADGVTW